MEWVLVLLCLVGAGSASHNKTDTQTREGKQSIGIFSVVKFPNDACAGTNSLNGTCYTQSECDAKLGTAAGTCASSFGVCCTFSMSCGDSLSENNTYAIISSYSTTSDPDPCTYTFCKANKDVCKLRIDMEVMEIASPTEYSSSSITPAAALLQHNLAVGSCATDRMTVSNPGGPSPPVICGYNTGQHMFVDASASCNKISFNIDSGTSTTRKWQIKVTQYECNNPMAPVEDCLQYHTATSGTFASFNFDTSSSTVSLTGTHLQSQYYSVCFRRTRSKCAICFTPEIEGAAAAASSFGVSASGSSTAFESAVDSQCALTAATTLGPALTDFIDVVNLQAPTGSAGSAGTMRVCGRLFTSATGATSAATACTWSAPFKWGVHFDDHEVFANPAAAASAGQAQENVNPPALIADQGQGFTGFYMYYFQKDC